MRPRILTLAALIAAATFLAPAAQATQIAPGNQYTIHFYNLDQSFGNGGLFQYDWVSPNAVDDYSVYGYAPEALWDNSGSGNGNGFYSFCVEEAEVIHYNRDYSAELSLIQKANFNDTAAVAGGTGYVDYGNGLIGDPICNATAYLYYMFATGRFGDLNDNVSNVNGMTDAAAVSALQHAIWGYEQETALVSSWFTQQVDAYFGTGGGAAYNALDNYDAGADGPLFPKIEGGEAVGRYTVYVVNNTYQDATSTRAQDTLFMTYADYPSGVVPEPATFLIWGLGLCLAGLGWRRAK